MTCIFNLDSCSYKFTFLWLLFLNLFLDDWLWIDLLYGCCWGIGNFKIIRKFCGFKGIKFGQHFVPIEHLTKKFLFSLLLCHKILMIVIDFLKLLDGNL